MRTAQPPATTYDETPVFFDAEGQSLFGIFTRPTTEPLGLAFVMLAGGGTPVSMNRNRLSVRLCRQAAALGYHALRFDYHGVGESEGAVKGFRLDEPFVDDLLGAIRWIEGQGIGRFVLAGSCFGARTALAAAPAVRRLDGLALMAAPLRDYEMGQRIGTRLARELRLRDHLRRALQPRVIRGLFDPGERRAYFRVARAKVRAMGHGARGRSPAIASESFLKPLAEVVRRGVATLLVYGDQDDLWGELQQARQGQLGEILQDGASYVDIVTIPGEVHGFTRIEIQDAVADSILQWLSKRADRGTPGLRGG